MHFPKCTQSKLYGVYVCDRTVQPQFVISSIVFKLVGDWHYHGPNERLHLLYPKSQNLGFQLKCSYVMVQVDRLSRLKKDQIFPILKGVFTEIWTWPTDSVFFINSKYSTHISNYMSSNRNSSIFTLISIFWFKR